MSKCGSAGNDRRILVSREGVNGGQPMFIRGSAPLDAVLSRIRAGDDVGDVAADFGVPVEDIRQVLSEPLRDRLSELSNAEQTAFWAGYEAGARGKDRDHRS